MFAFSAMCVVAVAENHLSLLQTKVQNHVHSAVDDDDAKPGGNRPCFTQPGKCKSQNWNACYVGLWKEWECDDRMNELRCGQLGGTRSTNTWCPVAAPETTTAAPTAPEALKPIVGASKTNQCPAGSVAVSNAEDCAKLASALQYEWKGTAGSKAQLRRPGGCYTNKKKKVFFNPTGGRKYKMSSPLCQQGQSTPTTAAPTTAAPTAPATSYSTVGAGYCRPSGCNIRSPDCRTNGYRMMYSTDDLCRSTCDSMSSCVGYAFALKHPSKWCYLATSGGGGAGPSGFTRYSQPRKDIGASSGTSTATCYRKASTTQVPTTTVAPTTAAPAGAP